MKTINKNGIEYLDFNDTSFSRVALCAVCRGFNNRGETEYLIRAREFNSYFNYLREKPPTLGEVVQNLLNKCPSDKYPFDDAKRAELVVYAGEFRWNTAIDGKILATHRHYDHMV